MEYTRGIWEARELNKQQEDAYAISCEELGVDIAFVARYDINPPEVIANAHLIASAPALYEALKNIVDRHEQGLALGEQMDLNPAREALAKAEGKDYETAKMLPV